MAGSSRSGGILALIAGSKPVEIALTLVVFSLYAAVIGISLAPSALVVLVAVGPILRGLPALGASATDLIRTSVLLGLTGGGAVYAYLFGGALFQAAMIRILSIGIREGTYPAVSFTTLRWLIYSGIFTISMRTVLPMIPVSFLTNLYFRIVGCQMGRNVKINSFKLNDAYLMTLGDNVIIGGETDISCHIFVNDQLILRRITIGAGTLIGARSYISPGVTIGERCVIGLDTYVRSDHVIPDGSVVTSLGAIDVRTARELERGARSGNRTPRRQT